MNVIQTLCCAQDPAARCRQARFQQYRLLLLTTEVKIIEYYLLVLFNRWQLSIVLGGYVLDVLRC